MILYGTYDDPNRHLDPISPTATQPQTTTPTNSVTPATFTLEPHHSKHSSTVPPPASPAQSGTQNSSSGLMSKPIGSLPSPPPPPPPLNQYPAEQSTPVAHNHQQNNRPWLYSSPAPPPPPPLPPVTSTPPKASPTSPQPHPHSHPPSTTTSSYVTTFKTIVSTSSSSPASSSPPPPPPPSSAPPPPLSSHQQPHGNNGPVRVHIDQSGQVMKADFEVVSPPSLPISATASKFNTQQQQQQQQQHQTDARFRPTQGDYGNQAFNISFEANNVVQLKPPVNQIDSNKIDTPTMPTSKQTNAQHDHSNNNTINNNNNNNGGQQHQHELDGNQIDSKLSKDYRSSGDQSSNYLSTNTKLATNDLNVDSANKVQTKLMEQQQNSSANCSTEPNFVLFCLLTLIGIVSSTTSRWPIFDYLIFLNSIHVVRP